MLFSICEFLFPCVFPFFTCVYISRNFMGILWVKVAYWLNSSEKQDPSLLFVLMFRTGFLSWSHLIGRRTILND